MITVDADSDPPVRTVTLDRPERANALTREGLAELRDAVANVPEPVVVIAGAGDAFCGGADLAVVEDLDRQRAARFARDGQRTARAIADADAVVVAGVDGAARGGGVELALACDLRVATPSATFAETGVSIGLFGAWGGTVRLPEALGRADAADLALSGRTVDAERAHRMGLVSRVVDDPMTVAEEVAANDPAALRVVKRRLRDHGSRTARERREAAAFADLIERRQSGDN